MVCGRIQAKEGENTIYDYSACYYPEGIVDPSSMFSLIEMQLILYIFSDFKTRMS